MRKQLITPLVLLIATICSCSDSGGTFSRSGGKKIAPEKKAEKTLSFNNLVIIDSSEYVMFPLTYGGIEERGEYYKSSRTDLYWNIIFYNTLTKKYHLLDSSRKMVIKAYYGTGTSEYQVKANEHQSNAMFYDVVTTDYNNDKDIDGDDPQYLFTSDKAGKNFYQISPPGLHVKDWSIVRKTEVILMQTQKDSNGDRKFNEDDQLITYRYDFKTKQPAQPVFDKAFTNQLKALYKKQNPDLEKSKFLF